jgi:hypothetical protein
MINIKIALIRFNIITSHNSIDAIILLRLHFWLFYPKTTYYLKISVPKSTTKFNSAFLKDRK